MDNGEIADALSSIADLLELGRANPWRVRAYRRAARTIGRHPKEVAAMVRDGQPLTALPGIGADLARLVGELAASGRCDLLDELGAETPPSLLSLARVRGIGFRRARIFHDELDVRTLDELERAIDDGRVQALKGFGDRTAAKLRRAIAVHRAREREMRLTEAMREVPALLDFLRLDAVEVEAVGGYRRRLERIDRIELLAAADDPAPLLERLGLHAGLEAVEIDAAGGRATARLRGSLPIELRVVPPARFGSALVETTGPEPHVRALIELGAGGDHRREEEVYRAAGLPLVPPELRAGGAEIEAARNGALPRLVEPAAMKGDLQMHSRWSDGRYPIAQMAAACRARGYEYMAITDHSGSLTIANGLGPERVEAQWKEIAEVRAAAPGIVLLRSIEVDILPDGSLDLPDDHLLELDCVLASVHVQQKMPRREMTERILRAVQHPAVDILGHPTGKRGPRPSYDVDLDVVLRACAELGVAVELDCSPDRSDLSAENVHRALELGCTIVVDTDAHSVRELDYMPYGVSQARRAWCEPDRVLNTRPWPDFRRWLQRRGRRAGLDAL
jgi:DNA polymerase (family 10)